jgi:hypothetical protein
VAWLHSVQRVVPMTVLASDYLAAAEVMVVAAEVQTSDTAGCSWPTMLTWVDSTAAADTDAAVLDCDVPNLFVVAIERLLRVVDHYKMIEAAAVAVAAVLESEQSHL